MDWRALRDEMRYPGRRRVLRRGLCDLGLHWPVTWWPEGCSSGGGAMEPPEPCWGCETCGRERLPYRALWWRLRAWLPGRATRGTPVLDAVRRADRRWVP